MLSDPSTIFWNAAARANRLYKAKELDQAAAAYREVEKLSAGECALVRR